MSKRLGWAQLLRTRSAELSGDLSNWLVVGIAAGITFPSRIPPRQGLFGKRLGRCKVTLRLRNGYRLKCRLDELEGYYAAFVNREYENAVPDWPAVDTIVDVGANVGAASLWFARSAPAARIVAVEPSPDVFSRLVANIRRSGLQRRVTPVAAAVGAGPGLATVMSETWSVLTSTQPGLKAGRPAVGRITLDQLLEHVGVGSSSVLKLDAEGAEWETLLSASKPALRAFQAIVAEYHPVPGHEVSELQTHLERAGFTVQLTEKPGNAGMLVASRVS